MCFHSIMRHPRLWMFIISQKFFGYYNVSVFNILVFLKFSSYTFMRTYHNPLTGDKSFKCAIIWRNQSIIFLQKSIYNLFIRRQRQIHRRGINPWKVFLVSLCSHILQVSGRWKIQCRDEEKAKWESGRSKVKIEKKHILCFCSIDYFNHFLAQGWNWLTGKAGHSWGTGCRWVSDEVK